MSDVIGWRVTGLVTAGLVGVLGPALLLEPWMPDAVAFSMRSLGIRIAIFILPLIAVWMAVVTVFVDASIVREVVDETRQCVAPEAGFGIILVILWRGTRALCRRLSKPAEQSGR